MVVCDAATGSVRGAGERQACGVRAGAGCGGSTLVRERGAGGASASGRRRIEKVSSLCSVESDRTVREGRGASVQCPRGASNVQTSRLTSLNHVRARRALQEHTAALALQDSPSPISAPLCVFRRAHGRTHTLLIHPLSRHLPRARRPSAPPRPTAPRWPPHWPYRRRWGT